MSRKRTNYKVERIIRQLDRASDGMMSDKVDSKQYETAQYKSPIIAHDEPCKGVVLDYHCIR